MVIAWVNGVFSGLDHLRRLRRAPSAQTRTEAQPRSDHRTMQQLRQGDAERKSGERVSRPRRTRPAARGGRTSRVAVAGRPATLSPGGTPAAQAVRRAQSGVAFRPAGARRTGLSRATARSAAPAARTALQAQAGRRAQVWRTWVGPHSKRRKRPPARPRAGNPESTPRERPPFSPTNYDGGGSPGGMRGRGGEGGAAAGGRDRTGPGVRAGGRWRSDGTALLRGWAVHHYRWEPRSHED